MRSWLRRRLGFSRRYRDLHRTRSLVQSFNYAFEGIIHVLATQRNMRIHFAATLVALGLCMYFGVRRTEFALVMIAASMVIIAEMLNTAVEAAVDLSTRQYNPLAKIAKDVAAGAVFIAAANALVIAYLVFGWRIGNSSEAMIIAIRQAPVHLTVIALTVTFFGTIALKAFTGREGATSLRGGWPSGHAAIAFSVWMAVTMITYEYVYGTLLSVLTFLLATLVAHTRVESGVHTVGEVIAGAVFGSLVSLTIFQFVLLVS